MKLFRRNRWHSNRQSNRGIGALEQMECRQLLVANAAQVIADSFVSEELNSTAITTTFEIPDVQREGNQADKRIVNGEQTNDYEAVGLLNGDCTATLIGSRFVLTAAHCVENGNGGFMGDRSAVFEVGGQTYRSQKITVHPDYDPNNFDAGNDIAIIELRTDVVGVDPMNIMRDRPAVGSMLTLVGFGEGGTSRDGYDPNDNGKQAGETELERVTSTHLWWNFDSHNEANTAPGDSGGPAIITIDGERLIAGVTSGGTGDAHRLGDQSFDTRVDVHQNWIDNIVGEDGGGNDGDGDGQNGEDDHADSPGPDATVIVLNNKGKAVGRGELETAGDQDVFKITLENAGSTIIRMTETNSDVDTYLKVFDADGNLIAENDDFGNSLNSRLKLNLDAGEYYIAASSATDSETGRYRVNVSHKADAGGDNSQKTFVNNNQMEIKDDRVHRLVSKLKVAGMSGKVSDINVQVDIDHSWMEDLRLVLISPSGEKVVLSRYLGEDGNGYDKTIFDDEANLRIQDGDAPFRGTFRPVKTLSKLDGINPNGTWRLVVHDTFELDGGTLNQWKLTVTTDSSRQSIRPSNESCLDSYSADGKTVALNPLSIQLEKDARQLYQFELSSRENVFARVNDFGTIDSRIQIFDEYGNLAGVGSDLERGSNYRGTLDEGTYFASIQAADQSDGNFTFSLSSSGSLLTSEKLDVLDSIFAGNEMF